MCDFSDELKRIVFSDMTDEEKEKWIKVETAKENMLDFWAKNPQIGTSYEELGLTQEDFDNAPKYDISDKDYEMKYTKEDFLAKPTPLYRYESYAYPDITGYGSNSRRFCKEVATRTRTNALKYHQILALNGSNPGFGYDGANIYNVFRWRGGNWCKHFWTKYYYDPEQQKLVEAPTNEQPRQVDKGNLRPPKK